MLCFLLLQIFLCLVRMFFVVVVFHVSLFRLSLLNCLLDRSVDFVNALDTVEWEFLFRIYFCYIC